MAITIQCYSESDNEAFFGGDLDHEQLPAPTYDEPKARTGKPPVVIDNRSVRLWLIETGCLSYSQLAEAYPWADDVFTGLSRPSGLSNSGDSRSPRPTCSLPYMAPTISSPAILTSPTRQSRVAPRLLATYATLTLYFRLPL